MKNDSGDLYLNKKRLATDVYTYSLYNIKKPYLLLIKRFCL